MSSFVFHIIEYITVKTSFFIIENTLSFGYYIGASTASYIYSSVTSKNKSPNVNVNNNNNTEDIELDELKKNIIQLSRKVDELEKHFKE
jgi:hypothetical protein